MSDHLNKRITKLEQKVGHLERSGAPGQQDIAGISPQDTTSQEADAASRQPLTVSQIPPSPRNAEKPKDPWYKTAPGWKTFLEFIAIPFAIGYAIVTYCQWRDLRHNFMIEQRAWMKLEAGAPNSPTDQMFSEITFANVGKSPAINVEIDGTLLIVDSTKPPDLAIKQGASTNVRNFLSDG